MPSKYLLAICVFLSVMTLGSAYCPANETVFNGTCSSDWYLCSGAVDFPFGFSLKSLDVSCLANVTSMNVDTVFEITEITSGGIVDMSGIDFSTTTPVLAIHALSHPQGSTLSVKMGSVALGTPSVLRDLRIQQLNNCGDLAVEIANLTAGALAIRDLLQTSDSSVGDITVTLLGDSSVRTVRVQRIGDETTSETNMTIGTITVKANTRLDVTDVCQINNIWTETPQFPTAVTGGGVNVDLGEGCFGGAFGFSVNVNEVGCDRSVADCALGPIITSQGSQCVDNVQSWRNNRVANFTVLNLGSSPLMVFQFNVGTNILAALNSNSNITLLTLEGNNGTIALLGCDASVGRVQVNNDEFGSVDFRGLQSVGVIDTPQNEPEIQACIGTNTTNANVTLSDCDTSGNPCFTGGGGGGGGGGGNSAPGLHVGLVSVVAMVAGFLHDGVGVYSVGLSSGLPRSRSCISPP